MKTMKWVNTAALGVALAVNALANLLPIGGHTTAQVSEMYTNLFTPAPVTFAIWGVIYVMMAAFVLYQWELFDGGEYSAAVREKVGPWFAISCAFNAAWMLCWHLNAIGLSVLCMAGLLFSLIMIGEAVRQSAGGLFHTLMGKTGFDIYLGWIIAAAIANVSAYLTKTGWNGFGFSQEFRTVIMLLAGSVIAAAVVLLRRNRMAGAAVLWAYAGILIRHFSANGFVRMYPYAITAAFVGMLVIADAVLVVSFKDMFFEKEFVGRELRGV